MKEQDIRAQRSKEMLTEALIKLLDSTDAEKITIKQLTETAHLSRTTFYLHYEDMPSFLRRLTEETFAELTEPEKHEHSSIIDSKEEATYYRRFFKFIEERKTLFKAMLGPHGYYGFRQLFYSRGVETFRNILLPFQKEIEKTVPLDILVHYIISAHDGLVSYWLETDCKYSADYMGKQVQFLTVECLKPIAAINTKASLPR